ncbi:MAG: phenylacetate-CoA oxygenase subunit PaaC [Propionibacteriales bacterium]|nr:phenylacetate-CoA oxygenase subunit PaaC [Propionibacteriales bacterium]
MNRFALVLGLADDALIAAQRLAEWVANAPELEEDVALANIALDTLGRARVLLAHAGEIEGAGRNEDDLAMLRDEREFTNVQLAELENGHFGTTIARLWLYSTWQLTWWEALTSSTDETLAAVAQKSIKELRYHVDHGERWVRRLGDGTEVSHERMQDGLDRVWPHVAELFTNWVGTDLIEQGVTVAPATLEARCRERWAHVINEATLSTPQVPTVPGGGRRGIHTESMGYLLAEMQHMARSHPGATW